MSHSQQRERGDTQLGIESGRQRRTAILKENIKHISQYTIYVLYVNHILISFPFSMMRISLVFGLEMVVYGKIRQ